MSKMLAASVDTGQWYVTTYESIIKSMRKMGSFFKLEL